MAGPSSAGTGDIPLRRNRDFLLFWSGQVLSTTGTKATSVAFPLLVLAETGSAVQAGFVGFAQTLPFIVWFLPAGAMVDRLDRKRIMLTSEVIRYSAMSSIVVALAFGRFALWHILIVAFVEGSALVFFELSEAAALPHIVPSEQLPTALAQNQARQQGADLAGQPIGGALFGLGRSIPFAFDAASYAISFLTLRMIRPDFQDERSERDTNLSSEIVEGVTWLWGQPFLRTISGLVAVWNFVISALVLTVIVRSQDLGASPAVVGLVLAAFGIGAFLGVFAAPAAQRRFDGRLIVVGATGAWAASLVLLIPVQSTLLLAVVLGAGAAVGPSFNVMVGKYRYALTPDALQGRVLSAFRVVGWGAIPLGSLAAGLIIDAVGAVGTLAVLAVVMVGVTLVAAVVPSLRVDPLADAETPI